jgi:hypothetical protein
MKFIFIMNLSAGENFAFGLKVGQKKGEIFAFLCQLTRGLLSKPLKLFRYIDAHLHKQKSRWDYQPQP